MLIPHTVNLLLYVYWQVMHRLHPGDWKWRLETGEVREGSCWRYTGSTQSSDPEMGTAVLTVSLWERSRRFWRCMLWLSLSALLHSSFHSWIKDKFFLLITLSVMKTIRRTRGWSLQVVRSTVSRRNRRKRDDDRWKRVLIGAILTLIMVGSVVALMARIWSWLVLYYMKWWARCDSNARSPPREDW